MYVKFPDSGHHPSKVGRRHRVRGQRGGRGAAKAARPSGPLERHAPAQDSPPRQLRRDRDLEQEHGLQAGSAIGKLAPAV